jgi:exo-beta-1,3-glucanase (GH17 family)/cellulose synthase/poly-beta-1,6-N-acetylglucosamine synthase-like glycosyltransferase
MRSHPWGSLAARAALALAIVLGIASLNLVAWRGFEARLQAPDHAGPIAGLSYHGASRWQNPLEGRQPSITELEQDLALLARHTRRIRTYAAADHPQLPALAAAQGLQVALGAWLDERLDANARELTAAIEQARAHPNVHRLIVGNETQLMARLPPNRLAAYLDQSRAALRGTPVQISTAEPWHVWLAQPQLVRHVDFIAIHVLPYWEKTSIDEAVQISLRQIARVQARFPDRQIVIAEIGWPSNGPPLGEARATPANQALFVRRFLAQARAAGLDYYLMEAFDQPWKMALEGRAGAYWGLWDATRSPKLALSGPVLRDPWGLRKAAAASLAGAVVTGLILLAVPGMRLVARVALCVAAQAIVSLGVVLLAIPLSHYLRPVDVIGLVLVVAALGFMAATLLAQAFEFADRFWPGAPPEAARVPAGGRLLAPASVTPAAPVLMPAPTPFISIHLACANEPPAMVIETVESLLAIDWPAFEVIVVDNNTADPLAREQLATWMAHRQDARLRFAQWPQLPGYKAGALNQALAMTDPAAAWIAVVDADYTVDAGWFRAVQTCLGDASVGLVQAPQAHRRWSGRRVDRMMNWETEGFFRIGMHHRDARNAIIQHGTMTLVRAAELRQLRWNEDCVCEDTELGLRLLRAGGRAVYVDQPLGAGLLPRDFAAYARQRKRWAQGAMQILRQHAASLLGRSSLSGWQRYHFLAGWLPWLGDALHLLFSIVMIVFSLGLVYLPDRVDPPLWLFVLPLLAFFGARLLVGPLLYIRCVPCGFADRLGAAVAGMALSHRIARGVWQGLRARRAVFEITPKAAPAADARMAGDAQRLAASGPRFVRGIEEEFALLVGLLFCIGLLWLSRDPADGGRLGWIAILSIQSLPYAAAVVCRLVEERDAASPLVAGGERGAGEGG